MPAPRGGPRHGDSGPARGPRRAARPAPPRGLPPVAGHSPRDDTELRPFRAPEYRTESTTGLRNELADLRAEVKRLAAEIDKLWARERGRSAAALPGRTARSIAGKPVRTGTRAGKPSTRGAAANAKRTDSGRPKSVSASAGKRAGSAKRSSGWAKPKTRSRRAGTTPRQKGR